MLPMEHSTSLEQDSGIFYTTNSNDGYSAIEYTDEHTTVSIAIGSASESQDAWKSRLQ